MQQIAVILMLNISMSIKLLVKYTNTYGRWLYAAGNFLPYEIRQVFPCWDKPSIRVIIHFLFIGSPQSYTVLTGLPGFTGE